MSEEQKEYKCSKCNTTTWLSKPLDYCVCGGKLYCPEAEKAAFDMLEKIVKGETK